MFQPGQSVTILSAPSAYPWAPGKPGTVHFAGTDPVSRETVYSVITTERVAVTSVTRPGGRGSMPADVYEVCGLRAADIEPRLPYRINPVVGGTDADPFGAPGETRYRLTVLEWPGRGAGSWTWYRDTEAECAEIAERYATAVREGRAGDNPGDEDPVAIGRLPDIDLRRYADHVAMTARSRLESPGRVTDLTDMVGPRLDNGERAEAERMVRMAIDELVREVRDASDEHEVEAGERAVREQLARWTASVRAP